MQMACILTITCISSMLRNYGNNEKRRYFDEKTPITRTWLFRLVYSVVLPTLGASSVILAIYWAADVFNLSDTTIHYFTIRLVDSKKLHLQPLRRRAGHGALLPLQILEPYVIALLNYRSG
jgi:hypothetical protein